MYGISSPFSVMGGCRVYSWFFGVMNVSVDFAVETFSLFGAMFPLCVCILVDVWRRSRR